MQLRGTYKEIWQISYPVILGSIAHSVNQLIDTAFLGHSSKTALEAITIGGIFYFVFVFIAGGLARGSQVIIARYSGENKTHKIGIAFDHLLLISIVLSGFLMLFFHFGSPTVLNFVIKSKAIQIDALE